MNKQWPTYPGTESMGTPWKNHGKSMAKIPWIPLKTMKNGSGAKFHGFHGEIFMLSMLAWNRKIVKIFPMKAWKGWNLKPWKTMESIGIYKNESMGSMMFSSVLLLIISRKHRKHGKKAWKAWESMGFMQMNLHPSGSLVAAGFPGLY